MKRYRLAIFLALALFVLAGCGSAATETPAAGEDTAAAETAAGADAAETPAGEAAPVQEEAAAGDAGEPEQPVEEELLEVREDGADGLRARWAKLFNAGAEGINEENGEHYYFAYDDVEDLRFGVVIVLDRDQKELLAYNLGEITDNGSGKYSIGDVEGEVVLPFTISEKDQDGFVMTFQDGDSAYMHYTDQATIIDDMVSIWVSLQA